MAMVLDWMVVDLIALYAAIIFDRHQKRKLSEEAFFFNMAYLSWGKRCLDRTYKYKMAKDTLSLNVNSDVGGEW